MTDEMGQFFSIQLDALTQSEADGTDQGVSVASTFAPVSQHQSNQQGLQIALDVLSALVGVLSAGTMSAGKPFQVLNKMSPLIE